MDKPALTSVQYRAVLEAAGRIHAAENLAGFANESLTALKGVVRADVATIVLIEHGRLRDYSISEDNIFTPEEIRFFEERPDSNPIVHDVAVNGGLDPRRLSDLLSLRQLRATDFYNHCLRRNRFKYALGAPFALEGGALAGYSMNRVQSDFSDEEKAMIALLGPHLSAAWQKLAKIARLESDAHAVQGRFNSGNLGWHTHLRLRALGLSRREAEVLQLLADRLTNAEIAVQLGISVRTVETHLEHIFAALNVRRRQAAAEIARRMAEL